MEGYASVVRNAKKDRGVFRFVSLAQSIPPKNDTNGMLRILQAGEDSREDQLELNQLSCSSWTNILKEEYQLREATRILEQYGLITESVIPDLSTAAFTFFLPEDFAFSRSGLLPKQSNLKLFENAT